MRAWFVSQKWISLIILIAVALRLWGISFGLPSLNDPDEPLFIVTSLTLIAEKTLNPGWFGHPGTTTIYALALINLAVVGIGMMTGRFASLEAFARYIYSDPSILFVSGRVFMAVCGILSIILLYNIVCRLADQRMALIAAAILAVMPIHIGYSQIIRTDMQASVFMLLCIIWSIKIHDRGRLKDYAVAGIMVGLACATKWPAALIIVAPIAIGLMNALGHKQDRVRHIIYTGLTGFASIIALFSISPYLLIEHEAVIRNLLGEFQADHVGSTGKGFLGNVNWYIFDTLYGSLGTLGLILCGLGLIRAARSGRLIVATTILPTAIFFIFICLQTLIWDRWLVPLLPFVAFFMALGIAQIWDWATARIGDSAAHIAIVAGSAALVIPMLIAAHAQTTERLNDTRNQAAAWAKAHIPDGSTIIVEHLAFDLLSPRWRFVFPAGDAGCVDVTENLNGKIQYSSIDNWRGSRAVVDFGTVNRAAIANCRADYAVFTHYDRYVAERARYDKEARTYEDFSRGGKVMRIFRPQPGRIGGPVVRVVRFANAKQ
jgi:Dolichyl-phosphate-mannose-protein mannosyltransferase